MKKYFLLLGCSLIAAGSAVSAVADNGLKAVKDLYLKEFQAIDTDNDGKVSQEEFLSHQFNSLRANINEVEGFAENENSVEAPAQAEEQPVAEAKPVAETPENIVGVPSALSDMADYELDGADPLKEEPLKLTKEDVMPEGSVQEPVEELDLSISEEENLRQLIEMSENKPVEENASKEIKNEEDVKEETTSEENVTEETSEEPVVQAEEQPVEQAAPEEVVEETDVEAVATEVTPENVSEKVAQEEVSEEANAQETQIRFMLDTIKKTLPKKIDEITTWIDIKYADSVIDYIYKAEIDTASFSAEEVKVLKDNIQNEACARAYSEMCPKIKPMFIDKGIDMRIIYLDKADGEISSCEFNKTTCNE